MAHLCPSPAAKHPLLASLVDNACRKKHIVVVWCAVLLLLSLTIKHSFFDATSAVRLSARTVDRNWTPKPVAHMTQDDPRATASIVVLVTSKADSRDRRHWLRRQLAKSVNLLRERQPATAAEVVLKFTCGTAGVSEQDLNLTALEQRQHGDMLLLDIIDSNYPDPPADGVETATALKVVHGVQWAVKHYHFPWLVRLGDDAFFRVDHFLLNVAHTLSPTKLVFGYAGELLHSQVARCHRTACASGYRWQHDLKPHTGSAAVASR